MTDKNDHIPDASELSRDRESEPTKPAHFYAADLSYLEGVVKKPEPRRRRRRPGQVVKDFILKRVNPELYTQIEKMRSTSTPINRVGRENFKKEITPNMNNGPDFLKQKRKKHSSFYTIVAGTALVLALGASVKYHNEIGEYFSSFSQQENHTTQNIARAPSVTPRPTIQVAATPQLVAAVPTLREIVNSSDQYVLAESRKTDTPYPTRVPTRKPTAYPTEKPTDSPTEKPIEYPTKIPTKEPTPKPTKSPTPYPTSTATATPTATQEPVAAVTEVEAATTTSESGTVDSLVAESFAANTTDLTSKAILGTKLHCTEAGDHYAVFAFPLKTLEATTLHAIVRYNDGTSDSFTRDVNPGKKTDLELRLSDRPATPLDVSVFYLDGETPLGTVHAQYP